MSQHALQALTEWLEDALERQENLLAICIAQGEAARVRDLETLEARTAALQLVIEEAARAEQARHDLVAAAAQAIGLGPEVGLSALAQSAPEPWAHRLAELKDQLRDVLERTRLVVRENNFVVRRGLQRAEQVLQSLGPPQVSAGYPAPGAFQPHRTTQLLNTQG